MRKSSIDDAELGEELLGLLFRECKGDVKRMLRVIRFMDAQQARLHALNAKMDKAVDMIKKP